MRSLAEQGVGVVFITHKLREVMAAADRVVVLRAGKVVGSTSPAETDQAGLAQMMVGRSVVLRVEKVPATPGKEALQIENLHVNDDRGHEVVRGVDLNVRAGEILGIAGVEGNGQFELVEAICGMRARSGGRVLVAGKETPMIGTKEVHNLGLSHIPQDRELHGLVGTYSIADNIVLNRYDELAFKSRGLRNIQAIREYATALVKQFDIRVPTIFTQAGSLSGGNKQKVVVARELSRKAPVLVAAQPTRGVDVGSIEFIHQQLIGARDAGQAVLLVSAELDEIMSLSDRIAVMYGGRVVAIVDSADADRQHIGRLMAGLSE
jgi:general nucleoside transport system ATP-binding protein